MFNKVYHACAYVADQPTASVLTTVPSNNTILRGSKIYLICKTNANPNAHTYQFYFNGAPIGSSNSGVFIVDVEKDGVYTCVPINRVGTGQDATVSVTVVGR